jgi:hypothetical protein
MNPGEPPPGGFMSHPVDQLQWNIIENAKRAAMVGVHGAAKLADIPLAVAQGVTQGGDWSQSGNVTIDPNTGSLGVTPEAQTAGSFAATPLRFGGARSPTLPPRIGYDPAAPPSGAGPQFAEETTPSPPSPKPEDIPTVAVTAKGSTYEVHPSDSPDGFGATTRNKAPRPEHGPDDHGPQPRSDTTFYVSPEDADKLGEVQTQGGPGKIIAPLGDGSWGMKYTDGPNAGKFERRTVVRPKNTPEVGLTPVELWNNGSRVHFGNDITEVRAPTAPETPDETPPPPRQTGRAVDTVPQSQSPEAQAPIDLLRSNEPWTADRAKSVANLWYSRADQLGGTLNTNLVDNFLDNARNAVRPRTRGGAAIPPGSDIVGDVLNGLEGLRGEPLSLGDVHEMDVRLGQLIRREYGVGGMTGEGEQLLSIQSALRDTVDSAIAKDVNGGTAGFQAVQNGRRAWAQARKLQDLEQMIEESTGPEGALNTTALQGKVTRYLANPKRSRGWTDLEKEDLRQSASRGAMGHVAHFLGNKFLPMAATIAEAGTHGLTFGVAGHYVAEHLVGAGVRRFESRLQEGRLKRATGSLGESVPPPPGAAPNRPPIPPP